MYCTHCGSEYKENTRFCSKCGQPIPSQGTPIHPMYNNAVPQPSFAKQRPPKWPFVILGVVGAIAIFVIAIICFAIGITNSSSDKKDYGVGSSTTAVKNTSIEKEELVGTWKATMKTEDMLRIMDFNADKAQQAEAMIKILKNITADLEVPIYYCFEEDGSVAQVIKKNEWIPAMKKLVFDMLDYMKNGGFYEMMEATTGNTKEEIEKQLSSIHMTVDQYVDRMKSIYESMSQEQWETAISRFENYKVDGYYLLDSDVDTYELTKNEIIFSKKDTSESRRSPYSFEDGKLTLKVKLFADIDDYISLVFQKTDLQ